MKKIRTQNELVTYLEKNDLFDELWPVHLTTMLIQFPTEEGVGLGMLSFEYKKNRKVLLTYSFSALDKGVYEEDKIRERIAFYGWNEKEYLEQYLLSVRKGHRWEMNRTPVENPFSYPMTILRVYRDYEALDWFLNMDGTIATQYEILQCYGLEELPKVHGMRKDDKESKIINQLILDGYQYGLLKENPSDEYCRWFESVYEAPYPVYLKQLNKKLISNMQESIQASKKEAAKEEEWKTQRAERGYSDVDVWNIFWWFICTLRPMLDQLRRMHKGYPASLLEEYFEEHKDSLHCESFDEWVSCPYDEGSEEYQKRIIAGEVCSKRWEDILARMSFLLGEMDEETCTKKNPFEEEWWSYVEQFNKKYPKHGDELKTEEELQRDKETGTRLHVGPERNPDFGEEYTIVSNQHTQMEIKIWEYREACKDEFFQLFAKHFWSLWD